MINTALSSPGPNSRFFFASIHNGARPRHLARRHLARREVSVQVRRKTHVPPEVREWFCSLARVKPDWTMTQCFRFAKRALPSFFEHAHIDTPRKWFSHKTPGTALGRPRSLEPAAVLAQADIVSRFCSRVCCGAGDLRRGTHQPLPNAAHIFGSIFHPQADPGKPRITIARQALVSTRKTHESFGLFCRLPITSQYPRHDGAAAPSSHTAPL